MNDVGSRIRCDFDRIDPKLMAGFKGLPVANIGDCMGRSFCLDARIRPLNHHVLLGPALTVKVRPGDNLMLHKAIDLAEPGDIVLVDGQGELSNALIGDLMVSWATKRGIGALVIDGAVRDVAELRNAEIPIYAAGVTPAGPYKDGPGEINFPINCGGVVVHPGDLVAGDADGLVVIRAVDAQLVLDKTLAKAELERAEMEAIVAGVWNREWVDVALRQKGVSAI